MDINGVSPLTVAKVFVGILREQLSPEDFAEMCVRNATAAPGVCHSHDFLDANMMMEEAFHRLGLASFADLSSNHSPEIEAASDRATALWNAAWALATKMIGGAVSPCQREGLDTHSDTNPAIAIVTESGDFSATISWTRNPLPDGTVLYAAPRPVAEGL